jgi:hypothetical protein
MHNLYVCFQNLFQEEKQLPEKNITEKTVKFQKTAKMIQGQHQINHIVLKENFPIDVTLFFVFRVSIF